MGMVVMGPLKLIAVGLVQLSILSCMTIYAYDLDGRNYGIAAVMAQVGACVLMINKKK